MNNKAYYSDILSISGIIYDYENTNNSEILTLSSKIFNNYNNTIHNNIFNTLINNENNIDSHGYSISGNLNKLQNNIYNYANSISSNKYTNYVSNTILNTTTTNLQYQINNCFESGYNTLNSSSVISNQNLPYELTISAPINIQYGSSIIPGYQTYNAQGGKGTVTRSNYIRFNYGREWCISNQDDTGVLSQGNLYFRCGAGNQDVIKFMIIVSSHSYI